MRRDRQPGRAADTFNLVLGFERAIVVEVIQQLSGVVASIAGRVIPLGRVAEKSGTFGQRIQRRIDALPGRDHFDLEVLRPRGAGQRRRFVPVIVRLEYHETGPLARAEDQAGPGMREQRQPQHEMRVRIERMRLVIEEPHDVDAGSDHDRIEAALRQCGLEAAANGHEVLRVELGQASVCGVSHSSTL